MKKNYQTQMAAENAPTYSSPEIHSLDIETESGFAQSNTGEVDDLDEKDYGTY